MVGLAGHLGDVVGGRGRGLCLLNAISDCLQKAAADRYLPVAEVRTDPRFAELRKDPRLVELLQKIGLSQ